MAVIKKTNKKCWWRSRGWKRIPTSCWWKCKLVQPPWKAIWRLLRRLRRELSYSPAVLLQGTYLRDSKTQLLHCSTIYRSQVRNANKVSVNRWVNGEGKCSVQAQWNFTQPQEWNCVVCRKNKQTNGDYHMQKNWLRETNTTQILYWHIKSSVGTGHELRSQPTCGMTGAWDRKKWRVDAHSQRTQ